MKREGHIMFTVRAGQEYSHVPAHLDQLAGAARPVSRLDGGALDQALQRHSGGYRCVRVFHARRALGRPGEHHVGFDDVEESLGLARTYRAYLGNPKGTDDTVSALRDLAVIETAAVQTYATAPFQSAVATKRDVRSATEPHERVRAPQALALEPGDERVTTAIVDTGIVIGHPEFQRKCLAGYDTVDIGVGYVTDELRLVGDSRGHDYNPYD